MTKASTKSGFACTECGWSALRWVGRCGECQAWGSVQDRRGTRSGGLRAGELMAELPHTAAVPIAAVSGQQAALISTGIAELDRVLGGGLVPGAVVLLTGEPGVGKSTLLLEVAARWARADRRTLYVSGEESAAQVRLRAGRTDAIADELYLAAETDLGIAFGHLDQLEPSLLAVDSVQTMSSPQADGSAGGLTQVREVTGALVRAAKARAMTTVIIGHVTKDGAIAGPRLLEHLVDVVLTFDGDRSSGFRMLRASKNRFGPTDEVGCFELGDTGIAEVADPSGMFVSQSIAVPGTAITVGLEGRRPLLAEVQALVTPSPQQVPSRVCSGLDRQRLAMILAVLQKHCRMPLQRLDCHVSTVGGARVTEPSADLALAAAIASSYADATPARLGRVIALGEIGLAGELRRVPGLQRRIAEAGRLGFDTALVPASLDHLPGTAHRDERSQIAILPVATVLEALTALGFGVAGQLPGFGGSPPDRRC